MDLTTTSGRVPPRMDLIAGLLIATRMKIGPIPQITFRAT